MLTVGLKVHYVIVLTHSGFTDKKKIKINTIAFILSDTSDLREPEKVRACQEKALQALQAYTLAHYPDLPSKFGELLLRIPELQRTCQVNSEKKYKTEVIDFTQWSLFSFKNRLERKC